MKRLISILVIVAMMFTTFAAVIPAFATGTGADEDGPAVDPAPETTPELMESYSVNWKELVEKGTMRAQWAYERQAGQNNFEKFYTVNATETALTLTPKGSGENRSYYSDVMFDITADTEYEYVFMADKTNDNYPDAGVVFAWAADEDAFVQTNRPPRDAEDDIYPGVPKGPYFIMANWGAKSDFNVKYGAPYPEYAVFDTGSGATLTNAKLDEDGYATYKIVYNGLTVKMYFLDVNDAWVEFFADKTMTLVEGSKIAFGLTTWSPSHTNLKNCVVTAKNEAAKTAMTAAFATDKTDYETALAKAEAFAAADWFTGDWNAFVAKVDAAKAMADAAEYQYQVEYATAKLEKAMATLNNTAPAIKIALDNEIIEANKYDENQALYTEASWTRMTAARTAAVAVNENAEATQSAIVSAFYALDGAVKGLLTKELVAKNTYAVNWKYLVERTTMKAQWCFDAGEGQNNWNSKFTTYATENSIYAKPIGNGDTRQYYSTDLMFDITENTYYEYVFSAKNDPNRPTGYAGVVIGWAIDNNAYIENGDKNDWKGDIMSAYFLYGAFQNKSDVGDCFDLGLTYGYRSTGKDGDNPNYTINTATGENLGNGTGVAKLDADGYATYKVIYDGYNVTVLYLAEDDTFKPVFGDKVGVFAPGAKVALGIYNRNEGRNIYVKDAVLTSYNEAAAENIVNVTAAKAIAAGEAAIAEDNYTPATVKAVTDAIAAVKAIEADTPAADVDAAIAALQTAILGLKKADKTALVAAIEAVNAAIEGKTAADFEEKYYTPFATALADAIAANADENSTQEIVDAALEALNATFKYLTPKGEACKVDLAEILDKYAALAEDDYKPSSWATLETPFTEANSLNDAELTNEDQADVDAAVKALSDAINALVKRADFKALQAIYNRANGLESDDYKNWADSGIAAAITAAGETLENLELDQEAVDAAYKALDDAIDALVTWRTNVLAIKPADDYQVIDADKYGDNPTWYNKITDMSYHGVGNVFYYDYYKVVAAKAAEWEGFVPGTAFPEAMDAMDLQGDANYVLRLGTNMSGSGTNRVTDGEKDGGTDLSHRAAPTYINGKLYGHVFGFSFFKAPTVDSIAVYLPVTSHIAAIDVYGAVRATAADGTAIYGKADKDAVVADDDGNLCEDSTTVKKVYLGSVVVPDAEDGAKNILATCDFIQAMKVDYIYFALTMDDGVSANAYYGIQEIELFGLNDGETIDGNAAPDFTKVNALISALFETVAADYTDESWERVITVLEENSAVFSDLKATQAEIDAAVAAVEEAFNALVAIPADWSELDSFITIGSVVKGEDFIPNTYNPFKAAYDAAVALRASTNVPQTKVDLAYEALRDALAALIKRADITALKAAYDEAKELKEEEWNKNAIAWRMFANSLASAEALLADENATQAQVDDVVADLAARKAELEAADPVAPSDPVTPADPTDPGETDAPATDAPETEDKDDEDKDKDDDKKDEEKKGGCGSSVALSALAIVGVIGTAVVLKKKED